MQNEYGFLLKIQKSIPRHFRTSQNVAYQVASAQKRPGFGQDNIVAVEQGSPDNEDGFRDTHLDGC